MASSNTLTYTNPVYEGYLADPFVWRHDGSYYAIGTGGAEAAGNVGDRVFEILRSSDLVSWEMTGRALPRPDPSLGDNYWAPEVVYHEGTFYLYYSVGVGDKYHQLRVALSHRPEGPYRDAGIPLTDLGDCPFAIDAHAFRDDDGQWYLFHCRDFLDTAGGARAGTAIVVDRLVTMTRLAGEPRVVLRARHDWQRFQAGRPMYGGVYDWHTVEGPAVRNHDERYYCLYSGGRWETENYGVDYCVADRVTGPYQEEGSAAGPRILRTLPGRVIGPGHNSVTVGPDGRTEYLVYHAWDPDRTARRMFLDRLDWTPDGPRCKGPTLTPQRVPR